MNYAFFVVEVVLIYILSRKNIASLFYLSRFLLRNESLSYFFIAAVFFPGTVIHEAAHAVMALVLFLRVRSIELFPHKLGGNLRLGSVFYEKKDPVRSLIVGVAPLFAGLLFFWFIAQFKLFPVNQIGLLLIMGYLIFAVSSTMFSSKQDLKDILIALPILIIFFGAIYVIFGFAWLQYFLPVLENFLKNLNVYLLFSLIIHIILVVVFTILSSFLKI